MAGICAPRVKFHLSTEDYDEVKAFLQVKNPSFISYMTASGKVQQQEQIRDFYMLVSPAVCASLLEILLLLALIVPDEPKQSEVDFI